MATPYVEGNKSGELTYMVSPESINSYYFKEIDMDKRDISPEEVEFHMRRGRLERSLAVHRFLKRRYLMVKNYLTNRSDAGKECIGLMQQKNAAQSPASNMPLIKLAS